MYVLDIGVVDQLLQLLNADKKIHALFMTFCQKYNRKGSKPLARANRFDQTECRAIFPDLTKGMQIRILSASKLPDRCAWEDQAEYVAKHIGDNSKFISISGLHRPEGKQLPQIEALVTGANGVMFVCAETLDLAYSSLQSVEIDGKLATSAAASLIESVFEDALYHLAGRETFLSDPIGAFEFLTRYIPLAIASNNNDIVFLAH